MNYHNITHDDILNGEGFRVVLWVAGCSHHCKGCQNAFTWDENYGIKFDEEAKQEIFNELKKDYVSGITFSGGDPLFEGNRAEITQLAKEIKQQFSDKNIWLYTGFLWEEVKNLEIIKYLDVLVDGEYKQELRDVSLNWVGSSNQRIIDVQKTLKSNKVELYC